MSSVNDIPNGWVETNLGKLGRVITGKTPSKNNPNDWGNNFDFITPSEIDNSSKYIFNTPRKLSQQGFDRFSRMILPTNSVIVTCIGSDMGKVALSKKNAITNQQMNSIKVLENSFSDYLYAYFKEFKDELKSIAMGSSTMPMISKSEFELIKILKPNPVLLENYYKKVTPINLRLSNSISQSETLKELQSLLLAKMTQQEPKTAII